MGSGGAGGDVSVTRGRGRNLLALLAAGALLAGCSQNTQTGRSQFAVVPDEALTQMADQAWSDLRAQTPVAADPAAQARLEKIGWKIVEASGRDNAAVLIDAFHLSRSRSRIEDIARLDPKRLHYLQLCDVPAALPITTDALLAQARGERLFPGEGELDLLALLRAVPRALPLSIEAPTLTLAQSVPATERARRALAATRRVLARLDVDT